MLKSLFGSATRGAATTPPACNLTPEGMLYECPGVTASDWLATPFAHGDAAELGACLSQAAMDGLASTREQQVLISWDKVYALLKHEHHASTHHLLQIPESAGHRPVLQSKGSVGGGDFAVAISHWVDGLGVPLRESPEVSGATISIDGRPFLVHESVWALLGELKAFHARTASERTPRSNELAWARMRRWAVSSNVPMSDYLDKTIILTPEKLTLNLRPATMGDDKVMEVVPGFSDAPPGWLSLFDKMPLQDSYNVPDGSSMTKVVLTEPVKAALAEIKRMPGRRVAGARAEAFVRNPMGLLGELAVGAIDPKQVEQALIEAGVSTQRFTPEVRRGDKGQVEAVSLLVDTVSGQDAETEIVSFADVEELSRFCSRLSSRIRSGHQCCAWEGNDLEIVGETADHLTQLQAWIAEWRHASIWSASELFDLSNYSDRVSDIGVEKAYVVPFVAKKSVELDWFVENVLFGLAVRPAGTTQTTLITVTADDIPAALEAIAKAKQENANEVLLPNAPFAVPLDAAERAINAVEDANRDIERKEFDPARQKGKGDDKKKPTQLIIKSNIDIIDHAEARSALLQIDAGAVPTLPMSLHGDTQLKPHQIYGVAWLQHLWQLSPGSCRGALLADDMGLGKTLQLLTFIASCMEHDAKLDPVLVVAPLALLENWRAEVDKFFKPGALPLLTLYGPNLKALRVSKAELSADLAEHGITKLLRKDWRGDARIVLTTYETMRDLEFTLAAQPWSIMVCDEAQKIKNPSAMVTRTAKKQRVRFRIACTGTPVENSLMDLWCLFDFIQPGLLGALNPFSRNYRQPIEAKTDSQRERVQELRSLIEPQTLRRTKMQVARNILPAKREDESCRTLPMSEQQLSLYWSALEQLKKQRATDPSAQLQTLHQIRRICSDPYWQMPDAALRLPIAQLLETSPKLRWLISHLERLRRNSSAGPGDKVIIFCEFRDLQTTLQRVIREHFGIDAFVVNGDTSASVEVENSRQKLIDRFQRAPGFGVIVLSPLAVGFGVNIQAANHVIHFTRTWNPAKEDQATDRAYRIGQTRDVTVYYPSVIGNGFKSFDTILHSLLEWKRSIAQDMLNASGDLSVADFDGLTV